MRSDLVEALRAFPYKHALIRRTYQIQSSSATEPVLHEAFQYGTGVACVFLKSMLWYAKPTGFGAIETILHDAFRVDACLAGLSLLSMYPMMHSELV